MKIRKYIEPGYKAFNGYIFDEADCQKYNRIQKDINAFLLARMPLPGYIADYSFVLFRDIIGDRDTNYKTYL